MHACCEFQAAVRRLTITRHYLQTWLLGQISYDPLGLAGHIMSCSTRALVLAAQGFAVGAPSLWSAKIDSEMCQEMTCEICRHQGLGYRPFTKQAPDGSSVHYVILAPCPRCGFEIET